MSARSRYDPHDLEQNVGRQIVTRRWETGRPECEDNTRRRGRSLTTGVAADEVRGLGGSGEYGMARPYRIARPTSPVLLF